MVVWLGEQVGGWVGGRYFVFKDKLKAGLKLDIKKWMIADAKIISQISAELKLAYVEIFLSLV